jgi:ABC-type glycerol-3-phosphate transport system substrate-binding protein
MVTLTWWDNQQTDSGLSQYQQAAVEEFEAQNPCIDVEVVTVPYNAYRDRLLTAVQGRTAPDISTVDQIWNSEFAVADAIIPLDDYIANSETVSAENFFPGAWDSTVYEGQVWGIPFNIDVWQFTFYNNALLEAAGVDPEQLTTWEGLRAAAEAVTDQAAGQYAIGLVGARGEIPSVIMDSFIYSNGGSVLNEQGQCALDEPEAIEALQYLADLVPYAPEGVNNFAAEMATELFLNGSLATMWWPALVQPSLLDIGLDWGLVAGTAPEGMTPVGTLGGWSLVVYKDSPNQDAAWQFIEFLTDPEVNQRVVDLIPANIHAAEPFLEANRREPQLIMEHLTNARPRPLSPVYPEVSAIQVDMIQAIYSGTPVEQAVAVACEEINEVVEPFMSD